MYCLHCTYEDAHVHCSRSGGNIYHTKVIDYRSEIIGSILYIEYPEILHRHVHDTLHPKGGCHVFANRIEYVKTNRKS